MCGLLGKHSLCLVEKQVAQAHSQALGVQQQQRGQRQLSSSLNPDVT
jgi:hypothetical protein